MASKKGMGKLSISSLLWILLFQEPNSRILNGETKEFILSRNNVVYRSTEEQNFKQAVRDINPRMGLAQIVNLESETQLKETRFGEALVGSYASYQLSHTESTFSVCVDIFSVPRKKTNNQLLA